MTNPTSTNSIDYLGEYYKKFDKNAIELTKVLVHLEISLKGNPDNFFIQESIRIIKNLIKENEKYMDEEFEKYKNQFLIKN